MFLKNSVIKTEVSITLSEIEIRALDALAGYGDDAFLEVFYKHLGRHYLTPHENGIRSLFKSIRSEIPPHLTQVDNARKLLKGGL
jgi:hypothetical protein